MLLERNDWHLGYSQILRDCRTSSSSSLPFSSLSSSSSSPIPFSSSPGVDMGTGMGMGMDMGMGSGRGGGSALVLCHPDADALCAARMLTFAFRADGVPYQLRPVSGYDGLIRTLRKLTGQYRRQGQQQQRGGVDAADAAAGGGTMRGVDVSQSSLSLSSSSSSSSSDVRAVVLINMGANRNLTRLYTGNMKVFRNAASSSSSFSRRRRRRRRHDDHGQDHDEDEDDDDDADENEAGYVEVQASPLLPLTTRLYVLDGRRPYHLANIHAGRNIVLFNDRAWDKDVPSDGDDLSGDGRSDDDDDDESSDEEENDNDNDGDEDEEREFQDEDDEASTEEKNTVLERNNGHDGGGDDDDDDDDDDQDEEVPGSDAEGDYEDDGAADMDDDNDDGPARRRVDAGGATRRRRDQDDDDDNNIHDDNGDDGDDEDEDDSGGISLRHRQRHRFKRRRIGGDGREEGKKEGIDNIDNDDDNENEDDNDDASHNEEKDRRIDIGGKSDNGKRKEDDDNGIDDELRHDDDDSDDDVGQEVATGDPRTLRSARLERIRLYYALGSYHSSPVSWIAYTLLRQLRFGDTGDLLWLACVGVTDAHVHGRIDDSAYAIFALDLRRHVRRVYPPLSGLEGEGSAADRVGRSLYAEDLYGNADDVGGRRGSIGRGASVTKISTSENGRIVPHTSELRLFLLRHTSLWESLLLSPYVCSSMGLWSMGGVERLKEMLAKMGVPLKECRQPYAFVRTGLRRRLRGMMEDHAEEYGLHSISYTGFVRVVGYKSLISAADASYAATALLECDDAVVGGGGNGGAGVHSSSLPTDTPSPPTTVDGKAASSIENGDEGEEEEEEGEELEEERKMMARFNAAYDSLGNGGGIGEKEGTDQSNLVNGGPLSLPAVSVPGMTVPGGRGGGGGGLGGGLRLALSLQRLVVSTAVGLMERSAIIRLSHFRYAYLHCTGGAAVGEGGGGTGGNFVDDGEDDGGGGSGAGWRDWEDEATGGGRRGRGGAQDTEGRRGRKSMGKGRRQQQQQQQQHIFSKPMALTRLARFLMDVHLSNGKWRGSKSRPLVLLAERPRTAPGVSGSTYVVVGYECPQGGGNGADGDVGGEAAVGGGGGVGRNRFGQNFELAAQTMRGTFRFDGFDSNVVEVDGRDVQRFVEQLHYMMDSV